MAAVIRLFVRLSVTRVDQLKAVQARITKSSPSAAGKAIVLRPVKLFLKFKRMKAPNKRGWTKFAIFGQ